MQYEDHKQVEHVDVEYVNKKCPQVFASVSVVLCSLLAMHIQNLVYKRNVNMNSPLVFLSDGI